MRVIIISFLGLLLTASLAPAQTFPSRRIEIVVPYGPGGTGDVIARQIAKKFETQLGVAVVVLNKAGAGGTVGAANAARAEPDGHTLLLGYTSEIAIAPSLGQATYTASDFEPVALAGVTPLLLIGTKSLPATSLPGLLALVR